jgi:phospholipid transport system substrate-binding protein
MMTRRSLLGTAVAGLALAALSRIPPAFAQATDQAAQFVERTGRELTTIVNSGVPAAQRQQQLTEIIDRSVDISEVARFCLGRFWRTATPEQQKEYTELFHRVLVNNITSKVGEYKGVSITMGHSAPREGDIAVTTTVNRPNNAPSRVDWLISTSTGSPKIIDVIAEGTSLRLTQRSDYSAYLARNNNNIQALIDAMRQQANQAG